MEKRPAGGCSPPDGDATRGLSLQMQRVNGAKDVANNRIQTQCVHSEMPKRLAKQYQWHVALLFKALCS